MPNRKVIDISHHNDVSSWSSIRDAGVLGVIHKATEGTSYTDDQYLKRCAPAMRAGLLWGAYHFANSSNVQAQVDHFLDVVGVDNDTLYALDWEDDPNGNTMSLSQAKEFIKLLEERIGVGRCVVYSGNTAKDALGNKVDMYLGSHRLWLAQYSDSPKPQVTWDDYWLWQYSDGNSGPSPHGCPGVDGDVDTNSYDGSDPGLEAEWTGADDQPEPIPPPRPEPYPTLRQGDTGPWVAYMQSMLPHSHDGDFGPQTDQEVRDYQRSRNLDADGVVGPDTWDALQREAPPVPPTPPPGEMPVAMQKGIRDIANNSDIFDYNWKDRGHAPTGYTEGMALAFATSYRKWKEGDSSAEDMAKANTGNADKDALSWYAGVFNNLGMSNDTAGADTLRHLYVLMLGLGMRESSGRHCEGRDMSADNVSSDTAEAGMFQTSYNAHVCSDEFDKLFNEYCAGQPCYLGTFEQGVSCSSSEWDCYGSGDGYKFQELCKSCPTFAVETCAITLRNLRQHYGPINRREAEIRPEADQMFNEVQKYIDEMEAVA